MRVGNAEDMVVLREGLTRLLTDAGFDVAGRAGELPGLLEWSTGRRRTPT